MHALNLTAPDKPRWNWNGDVEKPMFSPSVNISWREPSDEGWKLIESGQASAGERNYPGTDHRCHSFIGMGRAVPGEIEFLSDCTHELAGKVVPLAELPPVCQ